MSVVWSSRFQAGWHGLIAAVILVTLGGCSREAQRVYQPNPPDPSLQQFPLKVAVVELEDGSVGEGFVYPGNMGNALIPGYIYATKILKFHQTQFGMCLASELKSSRMFATVDYHPNWENLVEKFMTYDLILTGRLHYDSVEVRDMWYGLSLGGAFLALAGLPFESFSREVAFDIVAIKPLQPDELLWKEQVKFEDVTWRGFYYGGLAQFKADDNQALAGTAHNEKGNTDFCTTEFLRPQFLSLRKSLSAALKGKMLSQAVTSVPKHP